MLDGTMSDSEHPPPAAQTALQRYMIGAGPTYKRVARIDWRDAGGPKSLDLRARAVLGSSTSVDICIEDQAVSHVHAEIDLREDAVWIRDLGSRNGTHVSGVRVESAAIPHMGKLRLGSTDLVLTYGQGAPSPERWESDRFGQLVGRSAAMRELFAMLARVAGSDAAVLIRGETGTGKELVARSLHEASSRVNGPYVVVDCAALPETLLDAELFGHSRGAFTGAVQARAGAIESADGGTVFLDEIGELPIGMQPKLLRVLEARTVRRIGETQHRPVDVRFVSATHRDLLKMVNAGEFREDLYFRLAVIPVRVPPLRERLDDVEQLLQHFLGPNSKPVSPELINELMSRPWRGNVRELRNFVDRARAIGSIEALEMSSEPSMATRLSTSPNDPRRAGGDRPATYGGSDNPIDYNRPYRDFRETWIELGERNYVEKLLERSSQNVTAAARAAGLDRTYLYRLIRKHLR